MDIFIKGFARLILALIAIAMPLAAHQKITENIESMPYEILSMLAGISMVSFVLMLVFEPNLKREIPQITNWTMRRVKTSFLMRICVTLINSSFFGFHFLQYSRFLSTQLIVISSIIFVIAHIIFIADGYSWIKTMRDKNSEERHS